MKKAFLVLVFLAVCGNAFAQVEREPIEKTADYWVYVRLEDRSGVTTADDAGRSKAGDVVAVLPVTPQHIPSETEKKEWMIYKTSLTETQKSALLETWTDVETDTTTFEIPKEYYEDTAKRAEFLESARIVNVASATEVSNTVDSKTVNVYRVSATYEYDKPIAYRKNKLDTSKLGVPVKVGLVPEKIDASKIELPTKTVDDLSRYETKRKFYAYVQRPLLKITRAFIKPAFAETISTINKTGEDYNTLTLWEDAVDGDLVTATSQPTAHVYDDDGDLTDNFDVDGSTSNASYYIKITSPSGEHHSGTSASGATVNFSNVIYLNDAYTLIENLVLDASGAYIDMFDGDNATSTMQKCVIVGGNYKIKKGKFNFYSNIILTPNTDIAVNAGGFAKIINNTIIKTGGKGGTCIAGWDNDFVLANNICQNFDNTYQGYGVGGGRTFATNLSDDAQFPGTSVDNTALDFVGSGDYHLVSADTEAIDAGTDYSGTFTFDIDGVTRSGTWDIGADEYVSASRRRMMIIQ